MSASNEQLGDDARERQLREIIEEEEQRLGKFTLEAVSLAQNLQAFPSPTLEVERNWNDVRWGTPNVNEPRI